LREALIEIVAADAVRVAFDLEYEAGMREDYAGNFCQFFACCGLERIAARVEENIRHVHNEAASGILRLQYRVQLPEKLCAEFRFFFRFCFGGGSASLVRVLFLPRAASAEAFTASAWARRFLFEARLADRLAQRRELFSASSLALAASAADFSASALKTFCLGLGGFSGLTCLLGVRAAFSFRRWHPDALSLRGLRRRPCPRRPWLALLLRLFVLRR